MRGLLRRSASARSELSDRTARTKRSNACTVSSHACCRALTDLQALPHDKAISHQLTAPGYAQQPDLPQLQTYVCLRYENYTEQR